MKPLPELEKRRVATEKTLSRFRNKSFSWREGRTCVHLARQHLRNMGHNPPGIPRIRSPLTARKAMKERGWPSVSAMLDELLVRIPPAKMLPGDLAAVEGDGGFDAIFVCAGPGRVFGWREDEDGLVALGVSLDELTGAWRV
jgi:hypothetical protein